MITSEKFNNPEKWSPVTQEGLALIRDEAEAMYQRHVAKFMAAPESVRRDLVYLWRAQAEEQARGL